MDNVRKNIYMTEEEKQEAKEARFAKHRKKCTELGFNLEYVEHTNCVLSLEQSWIEAKAVISAANSAAILSKPTPTAPLPNHCTPNFSTGGCL